MAGQIKGQRDSRMPDHRQNQPTASGNDLNLASDAQPDRASLDQRRAAPGDPRDDGFCAYREVIKCHVFVHGSGVTDCPDWPVGWYLPGLLSIQAPACKSDNEFTYRRPRFKPRRQGPVLSTLRHGINGVGGRGLTQVTACAGFSARPALRSPSRLSIRRGAPTPTGSAARAPATRPRLASGPDRGRPAGRSGRRRRRRSDRRSPGRPTA